MTTTLKQLCNTVLESAAKATARPWTVPPIFKNKWPEKYNDVANVRGVRIIGPHSAVSCGDESNYIVLAANSAEKLARALLVMDEALETTIKECRNGCLDGDCGAEWEMEPKPCPDCTPSRQARADVERILRGRG